MADDTAPQQDDNAQPQPAEDAATDALGDAGKQALDRMKAERNEASKRAKTLERELEEFRKASMTEAERAAVEAEARGRQAAATEFGQRLARSEFLTAAARRNAEFDASKILDDLNLARYLGEDGEPDTKALAAAVERLIPAPVGTPSFDGGARMTAPSANDMNAALRRATGRA